MRSFSSPKSGETSSPASKSGSQAPAARAGAALQRMAGPQGAPTPAGQLMQLQSAVGNQAVLQLLASEGQRRVLPDPKSALPPVEPAAYPGAGAPIQRVRDTLAAFVNKESIVTPAQLMGFLDRIDEQLEELHDEETANSKLLAELRSTFLENYTKLLEEIKKEKSDTDDPSEFAIAVNDFSALGSNAQKYFRKAMVSLRDMRNELNRSLEVHQLTLESRNQLNGYKEEKQKASYKEPERAKTITEWDDHYAYLYRRMSVDEYNLLGKVNEKKKLEKVTPDNNSRKWLSTSNAHSFAFTNEDVVHSGVEVKEVIVRFKVDKKKLMKILEKTFPAYKTDSYKPKNKDRVLIHQELLAQGSNANTGTDEELETIFRNNEHFNIGFSMKTVQLLDPAIVEITATPVG
ncbi:hypothetical protein [Cohnella zeiphila]|uniref:Uncharacterized protein n=1 Tax=Cohnella zeiphila TaxID=2761120 RepID=A0A7X0SQF9_9BACL|nr:hypothetical protein [Cohnella zeiphila]MBB6734179.1 hypothetical protein [Cohnella zeiphila]